MKPLPASNFLLPNDMSNKINVTVFHGYAETPDWVWFKWLKDELEKQNIKTTLVTLPDPLLPNYKEWLKIGQQEMQKWDRHTIVVGHSLGGVLATRLLELPEAKKIHGLVTVGSPFAGILPAEWLADFFARPINWKIVRKNFKYAKVLHGKNDPVVSYDHAWRYADALGVQPLIVPKANHFMFRKHPEILQAINEII